MFFELLQIAIGNRSCFSQAPTTEEWGRLYALAQKQAMVGIAFRGVEQLPQEQRPPKQLLMQWYLVTERIKTLNADLDHKALAVANRFLKEGFPSVILKGQGVAQLYRVERIDNCHPDGNPSQKKDAKDSEELSAFNSQFSIREYRTPGDIDIWLQGGREKILSYVRGMVPDCKPVYHHVDFPVVSGLDIEVHFTPSWMNSPVTNRRLQRFFHENAAAELQTMSDEPRAMSYELTAKRQAPSGNSQHKQEYTELPVPNLAFNRVYILVHIYRHLFAEGIGLRQLLDYYFVLCQGCSEAERDETMRVLRSLKMKRFAGAVMWVLKEVYGMDDRYMLTAPDEREGRFLLSEIMMAGNFGQYDERLQHDRGESALHWGLRKVKRNFRFVRCYPSEVLWSPVFKLWHFFWRKRL